MYEPGRNKGTKYEQVQRMNSTVLSQMQDEDSPKITPSRDKQIPAMAILIAAPING